MLSKKNISPFLGSFQDMMPWKKLVHVKKELPFLPFYHAIGDAEDLPHIKHLYTPSNSAKFEADLEVILSLFQPISLEELILFSRNEIQFDRPVFHLSFDDGLRSVYEIAMPILQRKGIPATVFVNSDFVDNKSLFFRYKVSLIAEALQQQNAPVPSTIFNIRDKDDSLLSELAGQLDIDFDSFLNQHRPYMTLQQMGEWKDNGFSLGGHSLDHPYFHLIGLEEQKRQALGSLGYLRETLGLDYSAFAFPFSDDGVGSDLFSELYQNKELDVSFGTSGVKFDELDFHFQRTGMELGTRSAESIISGEYLYCFLSGLVGRDVRKR